MDLLTKLHANSVSAVKRARVACKPWLARFGEVSRRARPILRFSMKLVWNALAVLGLAAVAAGFYASYRVMRDYDLTPRQFALRAAERSGLRGRWVEALLTPSPM